MAKKFPPGRCIHCTRHFEELTSDHVFPRSWYPDSTPEKMEKWQVPACRKCNNEYGRLEEELLLLLGVCLSNSAFASLGMGARVVKAVDPSRGRNDRDENARLNKGIKLVQSFHPPVKGRPVMTLGGDPSGLAVSIPTKSLKRICEKIIRGTIYLHAERILSDEHEVLCSAVPEAEDALFDLATKKFGATFDRGPGIEVTWARDPERPPCGLFRVVLFGKYVLRGVVMPREKMLPKHD